jgi:hypothetical protein
MIRFHHKNRHKTPYPFLTAGYRKELIVFWKLKLNLRDNRAVPEMQNLLLIINEKAVHQ